MIQHVAVLQAETYVPLPAGGQYLVTLTFTYTAADPYAIHLHIRAGRQEQEWPLCRDSLIEAVATDSATVGEGDVQITTHPQPDRRVTVIKLTSPDGSAEFTCDTAELGELLERTEDIVPQGDEAPYVHDLLGFDPDQWPGPIDGGHRG